MHDLCAVVANLEYLVVVRSTVAVTRLVVAIQHGIDVVFSIRCVLIVILQRADVGNERQAHALEAALSGDRNLRTGAHTCSSKINIEMSNAVHGVGITVWLSSSPADVRVLGCADATNAFLSDETRKGTCLVNVR